MLHSVNIDIMVLTSATRSVLYAVPSVGCRFIDFLQGLLAPDMYPRRLAVRIVEYPLHTPTLGHTLNLY